MDQSFRARPAILKDEILEQIIKFLQQGIEDFKIDRLGGDHIAWRRTFIDA